jgi:hypothetical protein
MAGIQEGLQQYQQRAVGGSPGVFDLGFVNGPIPYHSAPSRKRYQTDCGDDGCFPVVRPRDVAD